MSILLVYELQDAGLHEWGSGPHDFESEHWKAVHDWDKALDESMSSMQARDGVYFTSRCFRCFQEGFLAVDELQHFRETHIPICL